MSHKPKIVSHYFKEALHPTMLRWLVNRAVRELKKADVDFDTIAFRGVSGALFGPPLAVRMNKSMLVVRKESSHSVYPIEGNKATQKYIIVDDFVSSGATVLTIKEKIKNWQESGGYTPAICQAIVSYKRYVEYADGEDKNVEKIFGHPVKMIYCLSKNISMLKKLGLEN
jgi:orotate phosphoribosyltransferase